MQCYALNNYGADWFFAGQMVMVTSLNDFRIAYLVLAHDNPKHLGRLLEQLVSDNTQVFLHIDARSNLSDFQVAINKYDNSQLHVLKERSIVWWGEFSMVESAFKLLECALSSEKVADVFFLLGGSHYPLYSQSQIRKYLFTHNTRIFIDLFEFPNSNKNLRRLTTYPILRRKKLLKIFAVGNRQIDKTGIPLKIKEYFKPEYMRDMQYYCGEQWWVLSQDAAIYTWEFYRKNTRFVQFFKHTLVPDEMFVHTIIGNSRYRENASDCSTFVEWNDQNGQMERGYHPMVLTAAEMKQLGKLRTQPFEFLMARKFNDQSQDVCRAIRNSEYGWSFL